MEVKRMSSRYRVVAGAAALHSALVGCSRLTTAPKPPQSRYVAASVCAGCHSEIAKSYRQTGMGRSFYRPTAANIVEDYAEEQSALSPSFRALLHDGRARRQWFQRRHQTGFDGKETNALEMRVDYVIGSGNHARSYLHRTASGRLIEMPVSWYAKTAATGR